MNKTAFKRLLVPVCAMVMSAAGLVPGTAVAGDDDIDCATAPAAQPIRVKMTSDQPSYALGSERMEFTAKVKNCSAGDWSGILGVWMQGPAGCYTFPYAREQRITVRAGRTDSFRYRADVPTCVTWYVVHAQLKDTKLIQGTDQVAFPVTAAPPAPANED